LKYLYEITRSLKEALQHGFVMGIKMAHFSVTKNLDLDRMSMATKWDTSQQ
jgi:hypothetical protein